MSARAGTATHPRCEVLCAECGGLFGGQVRRDPRTGKRDGFYVDRHGANRACGQYRHDHLVVPGSGAER